VGKKSAYVCGKCKLIDKGVERRVILRWILAKYGVKLWNGLYWLMQVPVAGCFEHGNQYSNSIKGEDFFYQLVKKNFAP
jgi:hypothetical protein